MNDRQDIRLAVVMNGGVSLAVWMSGVAAEMNRLVAASRHGPARGPTYHALLELLEATATIDVVAGTSAGGINAGFLGVGVGIGGSLDGLGRLWADKGGLAQLLRDPLESRPASLLQGDGYFLPALQGAYDQVWQAAQATPAPPHDAVDLYLTGTLYAGRRTRFVDDMGAGIDEIDHDTTFHFGNDGSCPAGDLRDRETMRKLAVASRCTSSFPGAFEPHFVAVRGRRIVDDRAERRWDTDAGPATFDGSQYVVDGGILLNKPIRPALEAIYRKPAQREVRRVLAYVAPTSGQQGDPVTNGDRPAVPRAEEVVMSVLTRLRSTDSVARELTEIRRTNEAVRDRRATRARLVAAMTRQAAGLACDPAVWQGYRQERRRVAARTIAELISGGGSRWSRQELTDSVLRQPLDSLAFIPADPDPAAALARADGRWTWGQTTVDRLGAIAVDVLRRAMAATPVADAALREMIAGHRARLYEVLEQVWATRCELNVYWRNAAAKPPPADDGPEALDRWMAGLLRTWSDPEQRARLYRQALDIAGVLAGLGRRLPAGHVPADTELAALLAYLFPATAPEDSATAPGDGPEVLRRMLMLDTVHLSLAGALDQPEQEVELVQVSALDSGLLTAVQAHHFGAFYRRSWRVNDWLRGRVDGTERLCQILLSPARLRQLGLSAAEAFTRLRAVATGGPGHDYLTGRWDEDEAALRTELKFLDNGGIPPTRLPRCAAHLARRIQLEFLADELSWMADALRQDEPGAAWLKDYETTVRGGAALAPAASVRLLSAAEVIGRQRLSDEIGTDDFARVSSQAAVVTANLASAVPVARPAQAILRALRGYALILWTAVHLATSRGRFGPRVVGFAVVLGSAAIALSLFAPNAPMVIVLLGVLLVLAGVTTGALLTPHGRPVGRRLALPVLLAVVAFAALAWAKRDLFDADLLIKAGVVVSLILLGSYVGQVRPKAKKTEGTVP